MLSKREIGRKKNNDCESFESKLRDWFSQVKWDKADCIWREVKESWGIKSMAHIIEYKISFELDDEKNLKNIKKNIKKNG